ncbi:hypothetical protein ACVWXO_009204 [Bradyrhizobium sp. LM2.7]
MNALSADANAMRGHGCMEDIASTYVVIRLWVWRRARHLIGHATSPPYCARMSAAFSTGSHLVASACM